MDEPETRLGELVDALAGLTESERELLRLEGWEGLDAADIATVLGISPNAVRIRLHRARRRLAHRLDRDREAAMTATGGETR